MVFVAALFARRLRVFLQIHLRHHVAAGVLHFQDSPVVHPKEERAGAVEFLPSAPSGMVNVPCALCPSADVLGGPTVLSSWIRIASNGSGSGSGAASMPRLPGLPPAPKYHFR